MAGGLATTSTVVRADFWRLGQCRPGDSLRFKRITWDSARLLRERTEAYLAEARQYIDGSGKEVKLIDTTLPEGWTETILHSISSPIEVAFRQSGDSYLHVTYGPMTSSCLTRAHIHHRVEELKKDKDIVAVIGTTRGEYPSMSKLTVSLQRPIRCPKHLSE
jgi:urea carboxylase